MSTKSRQSLYGVTIQISAERAKHARKEADRLACEAWNYRMLGYKGPAQKVPKGDLAQGYAGTVVGVSAVESHQPSPANQQLSSGDPSR